MNMTVTKECLREKKSKLKRLKTLGVSNNRRHSHRLGKVNEKEKRK